MRSWQKRKACASPTIVPAYGKISEKASSSCGETPRSSWAARDSLPTCVTTSGLITEDEVYVYGPDLPDIRADVPFAKIVLLETNDLGESEDEEKAYRTIRNIEFVRYHVFPVGYMVRVSAQSNEEQVRVSKKVINSVSASPM